MSLQNYTEAALKFAEETKDWVSLEFGKFYTTDGPSGYDWEESSDNAVGGLDISWTFHLTETEIRERAAEEYIEKIKNLIELAIDDEWDSEQLNYILKCLE